MRLCMHARSTRRGWPKGGGWRRGAPGGGRRVEGGWNRRNEYAGTKIQGSATNHERAFAVRVAIICIKHILDDFIARAPLSRNSVARIISLTNNPRGFNGDK